jgi:hypothetical protein
MVHDAHAPQITKPQPNAYIGIKWQPKENPHNITLTILDHKDWTPHKLDLATLHEHTHHNNHSTKRLRYCSSEVFIKTRSAAQENVVLSNVVFSII